MNSLTKNIRVSTRATRHPRRKLTSINTLMSEKRNLRRNHNTSDNRPHRFRSTIKQIHIKTRRRTTTMKSTIASHRRRHLAAVRNTIGHSNMKRQTRRPRLPRSQSRMTHLALKPQSTINSLISLTIRTTQRRSRRISPSPINHNRISRISCPRLTVNRRVNHNNEITSQSTRRTNIIITDSSQRRPRKRLTTHRFLSHRVGTSVTANRRSHVQHNNIPHNRLINDYTRLHPRIRHTTADPHLSPSPPLSRPHGRNENLPTDPTTSKHKIRSRPSTTQ